MKNPALINVAMALITLLPFIVVLHHGDLIIFIALIVSFIACIGYESKPRFALGNMEKDKLRMLPESLQLFILSFLDATQAKPCEEELGNMEEDKLSMLPEPLQLHILSFLDAKQAVQTSVLSKKWLSLWTLLPVLRLNSHVFHQMYSFDHFFNKVSRFRDQTSQIETLQKVVDYGFSYGVDQSDVYIGGTKENSLKLASWEIVSYPLSTGSFKNLTALYLSQTIITTTVESFSRFPMLKDLTFYKCRCFHATLRVESLKLSHLTLMDTCFNRCELTTPNLESFEFHGSDIPVFQTNLSVIKTAHVDFHGACNLCSHEIKFDDLISLFSAISNVESLMFAWTNMDILCVFSKQLMNSSFCNLKNVNLIFRSEQEQDYDSDVLLDVICYLPEKYPNARYTYHRDYSI